MSLIHLSRSAALLALALVSCSGQIALPTGGELVTTSEPKVRGNPFVCAAPTQSPNPLQRLTQLQYANTLEALVGAETRLSLSSKITTLYSDAITKKVSDFTNAINDVQMTGYQSIAESAYGAIVKDEATLRALAGDCIAETPVSAACRDAFIKNAGLHAFRRPLRDEEVSDWASNVFALGTDAAEGVGLTVYGLMLAPDFLLKLELGDAASADASTYALSPYEVASRISYGLVDAPPDATLYAAAAAGTLSTPEQVAAQVDRLLQTPAARAKVHAFFTYWLNPHAYPATSFAADFLKGTNVDAINTEYSREMFEYLDFMVFTKKATFADLVTSQESFARTPEVAKLYGHEPVTSNVPAKTDNSRKGLFMRGPVLATEGNETHPILRGVKFRTRFLCESFTLPSGVMTNDPRFFSDEARSHASTRDRTSGITAGVVCNGCHGLINPIGFAFENFDGLARPRSVEQSYSTTGMPLAQFPLLTASPMLSLGDWSGPVADGTEVITGISQTTQLPACFLKQVHRFYTLTDETPDDSCMLHDAYDKLVTTDGNASVLEAFRAQFISTFIFKRRLQ